MTPHVLFAIIREKTNPPFTSDNQWISSKNTRKMNSGQTQKREKISWQYKESWALRVAMYSFRKQLTIEDSITAAGQRREKVSCCEFCFRSTLFGHFRSTVSFWRFCLGVLILIVPIRGENPIRRWEKDNKWKPQTDIIITTTTTRKKRRWEGNEKSPTRRWLQDQVHKLFIFLFIFFSFGFVGALLYISFDLTSPYIDKICVQPTLSAWEWHQPTTTTSDGVRRDQQIKNSLSFSLPKKPVFYKTTKPDRYTQSIAARSGCFFFSFLSLVLFSY